MKLQEDVYDFPNILCECGNEYFQSVIILKEVPALMSPNGQKLEYAIQLLKCTECGKVRYPDGSGVVTV